MSQRRIRKLLIANRGEIAVRVIRTCKEMGIATVAVYSDADRRMMHVASADEAVHIGASPSRESYLNMDVVIAAAQRTGADAIHPGYGFLSENAMFAQKVADAGLIFVGPSPASMLAMGDKTEARKLVTAAGVPTVPGTPGPITTIDEAAAFYSVYGFPILIKAAAGGGGKGMRVVQEAEDFPSAFAAAQGEARTAFGDDRVYLEKYVDRPRHIEFQILADRYGNTIHLGERECSVQRRHQKVVEETPSVIVDETLREAMGKTAVLAAQACGYQNAGTIEFLVDGTMKYYFLEMNTRLQVEHPVTELRTGIDLVAQQIRIAQGERLAFAQGDIEFRGHAIECRICAEDPANGFLPATGTLAQLAAPGGIGIREDRGIDSGGEIPVYYDSMIAKLISWGATRDEARLRLVRALREYRIIGVKTNIPLCLFILQHPAFCEGNFDTHFLANYFTPEQLPAHTEEETQAIGVLCAMLRQDRPSAASSTIEPPDVRTGTGRPGWKHQRISLLRA